MSATNRSKRQPSKPIEEHKAAEVISQSKSGDMESQDGRHWLMKAEPDTRMVRNIDVAFPIEKLEEMGTSPWDGVRNSLAKRYMKEQMKLGDKILFYHSNTKMPGVAGLAEVSRESYPDYTAWDPDHPYYDASSNKDKPTWYMVDVKFVAKVKNFVPLSLFKYLATQKEVPKELDYLTQEHLDAIKAMPLVTRGRLSVQDVSKLAYEATILMGEMGGFEGLVEVKTAKKPAKKRTAAAAAADEAAAEGSGNTQDSVAATSQPPSTRATRSSSDFVAPASGEQGDSLNKRTRRR